MVRLAHWAITVRDIVLGRGSTVWRRLSARLPLMALELHAIGHEELDDFPFSSSDRVWVLSYSRVPDENRAMLDKLGRSGVSEVIYVSSASTAVCRQTKCYEYPRVKQLAEDAALRLPRANILTIGLMYEDQAELPGGDNVATSYDDLARFMVAPDWPEAVGRRKYLLRSVRVPFSGQLEACLYVIYGRLIGAVASWPCVLRPLDVLLRTLGFRWYGYTYLSNRLWIATTS